METGPKKRHVARWSAPVLGLALLACGGGASAPSGGSEEATPAPASASVASDSVDACALVTEEDATALFGQPASAQEGTPSFSGQRLGDCLWSWDTESSNQLLQFAIWTAAAYAPPPDAEAIDLGEEGYVRVNRLAGVDVAWRQDDRTMMLSYSTVGPEAPEASTRRAEVEALARRVAASM